MNVIELLAAAWKMAAAGQKAEHIASQLGIDRATAQDVCRRQRTAVRARRRGFVRHDQVVLA